MEFTDIEEETKVYPGEYIYHEPSSAIVLTGAFSREKDFIRVLKNGRLLEDKISNFKKIKLSNQEKKDNSIKRCSGCKGL